MNFFKEVFRDAMGTMAAHGVVTLLVALVVADWLIFFLLLMIYWEVIRYAGAR